MKYLAFVLSSDGIRPDPGKREIIRNFAERENETQLQSFLGRYNYYRQFVTRYLNHLDPFRDILQNGIGHLIIRGQV